MEHPIAQELLHNGQAFQVDESIAGIQKRLELALTSFVIQITTTLPHSRQVLGVTNYSHWGDANAMRSCIWGSDSVRQHMVDFAINRIDKFMHVGVTDRLMDSAAAAGVSRGAAAGVRGCNMLRFDGPCYEILYADLVVQRWSILPVAHPTSHIISHSHIDCSLL